MGSSVEQENKKENPSEQKLEMRWSEDKSGEGRKRLSIPLMRRPSRMCDPSATCRFLSEQRRETHSRRSDNRRCHGLLLKGVGHVEQP
ncbi:hypothetical protein NPIL_183241 [Nephila pilipes]|uniref:Uncharacterized protein n=1 Tax=Nephila pilipes TaxID=299642 RepID=A0A8X6N4F7_NEPPI|nr:hypothetical protein NPIL_183241 [Nephila pilipes]